MRTAVPPYHACMNADRIPLLPLHGLFEAQYRASRHEPPASLALRQDRLRRLSLMIEDGREAICAAVQADFGVRSATVTELADLFVLRATLSQLRCHLPRWIRPVPVRSPLYLWPAKGHVMRQPLGVVGVISPWNYPVQLALGPAAAALAAGNRVMLKPSELSPRTSEWLADQVARRFAPEEFAVVQGDAALAAHFASLPFDHLFFTGSTAVGRKVAQAAAANLTPTTLELGGKSPAIVDQGVDLPRAALSLAHGRLFNAGQTCIAPDHVLVREGLQDAFVQAYWQGVRQLFPTFAGNPDYPSILGSGHLERLENLLVEAQDAGATVLTPDGVWRRDAVRTGRQMSPTLVLGARPGLRLLEEEIFGPILPVLGWRSIDDLVDTINARPRPLALYWFGPDAGARQQVLERTVSGGVTVGDTLLHITHENLPFGGVGASGWGAYHGETGFRRFSHEKAVLVQSRWSQAHRFYPPYGPGVARLLAWMRRWL